MRAMQVLTGIVCLLGVGAGLCGAQTEVKVLKGEVRVETGQASVTVAAGQKGIVVAGEELITVLAEETMVRDLIRMDEWVQEERAQANRDIPSINLNVCRIESEELWHNAALGEIPNWSAQPKNTCSIRVATQQNPCWYDMEGQVVRHEAIPVGNGMATRYILHYPHIIPSIFLLF